MKQCTIPTLTLAVAAMLWPAWGLAQDDDASAPTTPDPSAPVPAAAEPAETTSLEARLAAVEAELTALREAALQEKESGEPSIEEAWSEDDAVGEFEPMLYVHGFFDVTFSYNDIPKHSALSMYIAPYATFLMSNVNLFIEAKPTQTLSTTVELAFSFMPASLYREPALYSEDGQRLAEPVRDDPWARDNLTTAVYFPGSSRIVRAQVAWQPRDWLGFSAGKFLTPYGVWNVDHAPTVVLAAHVPYMQVRQMMPLEQLGVQAFGRAFVGTSTYFDYAVTLSNGRTNIKSTDIGDLDNNKAVGLALGLAYDSAGLLLKTGGYLYYGKLSDYEPRAYVDDKGGYQHSEIERLSSYHELIASGYLVAEWKSLRLQTELIWTRGDAIEPGAASPMETSLQIRDTTPGRYFQASWLGLGSYWLLAYTLPLRLIDPVRVIPYVLYEYNETRDTQPYFNQQYVAVGLNVRPMPDVAIKLEYSRFFLNDDISRSDMSLYTAQLAVSY